MPTPFLYTYVQLQQKNNFLRMADLDKYYRPSYICIYMCVYVYVVYDLPY